MGELINLSELREQRAAFSSRPVERPRRPRLLVAGLLVAILLAGGGVTAQVLAERSPVVATESNPADEVMDDSATSPAAAAPVGEVLGDSR